MLCNGVDKERNIQPVKNDVFVKEILGLFEPVQKGFRRSALTGRRRGPIF